MPGWVRITGGMLVWACVVLVGGACGAESSESSATTRGVTPAVTGAATSSPSPSSSSSSLTTAAASSSTLAPAATGTSAAPTVPPTTVAAPTSTVTPATAPPTTAIRRVPFGSFGEIALRVQGVVGDRCALLAETAEQHGLGLMFRTNLGGYDGMLFVFSSNVDYGFYMKDTPMPLSIAWFDAAGRLVSTADMEPCLTGGTCPNYYAAGGYRYALEVPQGRLSALGITPGAVISVGGPCI